MEISSSLKERSTVITAILTLALIGLTLTASVWQTMRTLNEAEKQHLQITSRSVLVAIEGSLRRTSTRLRDENLSTKTYELFSELKKDGDVLFAGLIDHHGGRLLTAHKDEESLTLPIAIQEGLFAHKQWNGQISLNNKRVYISAKEVLPRGYSNIFMHESPPSPLFLIIGLDAEKYLSLHKDIRQTSFFQLAYILLAALLCWIFAFSFLARRTKANKAESLERFQARLLDNLPDGLITLSDDYVILSANPAAINIIPHKPPLIGKKLSDLPKCLEEGIIPKISKSELIKDLNKQDSSFNFEKGGDQSVWQSVNYKSMHLEILTLPISTDKASTFLALIRNRTQLRTLENNLVEAEKLASIGTLAASIAHEVRNPLSSLRGFAQYFVKKLSGQHPEEEYAKTMVLEADRLNRVITDLLFLSKPKQVHAQTVNLKELVDEMSLLLRFDLENKNTKIVSNLMAHEAYADEDTLKQSLLNLVLNSLEAIGNKEGIIEINSRNDLNGVYLEVADNGPGMDDESIKQAFEPFFTSKLRGTGLGLALVYRSVLDHGGTCKIESKLGEFCKIQIYLPHKGKALNNEINES